MHNHKGRCPLLFLVLQTYKIKTPDKTAFCIEWITVQVDSISESVRETHIRR